MYDIVVSMARTKMLMNAHKGNIEDVDNRELIKMAIGEIHELEEAITNSGYMEIIEEAADVLNFVIAAVHKSVHGYRGRNENSRPT